MILQHSTLDCISIVSELLSTLFLDGTLTTVNDVIIVPTRCAFLSLLLLSS
eukprot:m.11901 g.11901  ORF g.11901 m.11901 type:complete len:51 (+) comp5777_c0_seq1:1198-1350(+)